MDFLDYYYKFHLLFKTQRQKDLSNHWSDWRDEINKISELGRDIQEKNKQY